MTKLSVPSLPFHNKIDIYSKLKSSVNNKNPLTKLYFDLFGIQFACYNKFTGICNEDVLRDIRNYILFFTY